jgi:hypothetical protein
MVARGLHSDFSLGDSDANETDVRYWHLADIVSRRVMSAFGGKADIPNSLPYVC